MAFVKYCSRDLKKCIISLQTEFYLPYSVSEDVDFSLSRPEGFGCYRWKVADKYSDLVRLQPHITNYEMMCGNTLIFQIRPSWGDTSVDLVITGVNAKMPEFDTGMRNRQTSMS